VITEKDIEAFQAKLRLSNNFQPVHIIKKISPFDVLYNANEAEALEIILKSMYGPNLDNYNWAGLSNQKFTSVENALKRFLNLKGMWLDKTIESYAPQNSQPQTQNQLKNNDTVQQSVAPTLPKPNADALSVSVKEDNKNDQDVENVSKERFSKISDLIWILITLPFFIYALAATGHLSFLFVTSFIPKLLISPYSFLCATYVLSFELIGEGANGFEKGWWRRLLSNYCKYLVVTILVFELLILRMFHIDSYIIGIFQS